MPISSAITWPARSRAAGLNLNVLYSSVSRRKTAFFYHFEDRICAHDEVMECYLMTGDADSPDQGGDALITALERFIVDVLSPMPEVEKSAPVAPSSGCATRPPCPCAACITQLLRRGDCPRWRNSTPSPPARETSPVGSWRLLQHHFLATPTTIPIIQAVGNTCTMTSAHCGFIHARIDIDVGLPVGAPVRSTR